MSELGMRDLRALENTEQEKRYPSGGSQEYGGEEQPAKPPDVGFISEAEVETEKGDVNAGSCE